MIVDKSHHRNGTTSHTESSAELIKARSLVPSSSNSIDFKPAIISQQYN
jgi:hypothetical protein